MQFRLITTSSGHEFKVPEHILRRDDASGHGWQLRYGEWTDYPDSPGEGRPAAQQSLDKAMAEMQFRLDTLGK